jgi:DNA repair exonuclease SbcCD ATPase subunit
MKLLSEKELYNVALVILKDSGIKAKIIKQYIPIINKYINKYLSAMDFFVSFELDENFKETIKSRFRDEFSFESFSEGEKSRISLCILFTWRTVAKLRNSAATNLLIFDEIFDGSLDGDGTEEFMKILDIAAPESNVIVISHKTDAMLDRFDRVLKFEKVKNFSQLVD